MTDDPSKLDPAPTPERKPNTRPLDYPRNPDGTYARTRPLRTRPHHALETSRSYVKSGRRRGTFLIKLRGLDAIDMRSRGGRQALAFRQNLIEALGGLDRLSPQRYKVIDLCVRAACIVDHLDSWLLDQRDLRDPKTSGVIALVRDRMQAAEHLAKLLNMLGRDRYVQEAMTVEGIRRIHEEIRAEKEQETQE